MSEPADIAEAITRSSYGKLVAFLAARTGDVAGAEDALSEALAAALSGWPRDGIPANPEAWLLGVALRKRIDAIRRARTVVRASDHMRLLMEELAESGASDMPDHRLALMFVCAHPAIDPAVRAPLMLQTVLGLDAAAIGSAFLVAPATMGQRLVRAKARIRLAGIPFQEPERGDLPMRLDAVLDAVYAAFTAGWADPAGAEPSRRDLAGEAIWLCRLLVALLPDQAEAHGLLALMLYAEARRGARRTDGGEYVPLEAQAVAAWDTGMVREAEQVLLGAGAMGAPGRFQLEAAVQSAHVARRLSGCSNWAAIVRLYDALAALTGSPVVAINRAVAVGEMEAAAGLACLDDIPLDERLRTYQPYWAARAELLARTGSVHEARTAYRLAIGLEADPAVRRFLQARLAALG